MKKFPILYKYRYLVIILIFLIGSLLVIPSSTRGNSILEPISHKKLKVLDSDATFVYVITPTYARPVQKAELTRLSQTLRLVPNVFWIIVEDSEETTNLVTNLLKKSKLPHVQLAQPTPASWKIKNNEGHWSKPRGVLQRNAALAWIRENVDHDRGVIYFADDDNTYSDELFEEDYYRRFSHGSLNPFIVEPGKIAGRQESIRSVTGVGVWPVGLVGGLLVERPMVRDGRIIGFNAGWRGDRTFPIDMAGFAVALRLFQAHPKAKFSLTSEGGFQETDFLAQLTTRAELEPKAENCSKVLVWHTRTEKPSLVYEERLKKKGKPPSNYNIEV